MPAGTHDDASLAVFDRARIGGQSVQQTPLTPKASPNPGRAVAGQVADRSKSLKGSGVMSGPLSPQVRGEDDTRDDTDASGDRMFAGCHNERQKAMRSMPSRLQL